MIATMIDATIAMTTAGMTATMIAMTIATTTLAPITATGVMETDRRTILADRTQVLMTIVPVTTQAIAPQAST